MLWSPNTRANTLSGQLSDSPIIAIWPFLLLAPPRYDVICHLTAPTDWHGVFGFLTREDSAPIPQGHAGLPSREPHRRQAAQRLGPAWPSGLGGDPSVQIGEELLGANGRRDLER